MKRTMILAWLAMVLVATCLNAADEPSNITPGGKAATAPGRKINPLAVEDVSSLNQKSQAKLKRAHHLAEKGANTEFLNSPQGIAFKNQITAVEQEINATYEKYLNIFREDPATEKGKKLRAERNQLLQSLFQKIKTIEAGYETLKKNSPVYRAMVEKHLKGELAQLKGKLQSKSSEGAEEAENNQ